MATAVQRKPQILVQKKKVGKASAPSDDGVADKDNSEMENGQSMKIGPPRGVKRAKPSGSDSFQLVQPMKIGPPRGIKRAKSSRSISSESSPSSLCEKKDESTTNEVVQIAKLRHNGLLSATQANTLPKTFTKILDFRKYVQSSKPIFRVALLCPQCSSAKSKEYAQGTHWYAFHAPYYLLMEQSGENTGEHSSSAIAPIFVNCVL